MQDHLELVAQLADVHIHCAAVEVFWAKVDTEAWLVTSVNWIHKYPEVASKESERLILHAVILLRAQTDLLNLAHIGAIMLAHIPDPYNAVISEVCLLAERGSLLPLESAWHISKFEQECTKAIFKHQSLHDWLSDGAPITACKVLSTVLLMQIGTCLLSLHFQ